MADTIRRYRGKEYSDGFAPWPEKEPIKHRYNQAKATGFLLDELRFGEVSRAIFERLKKED